MHNYYSSGMGAGWGFGILDFVVHVAIIVLVVWFIFWLIRGGRARRGIGMWHTHSALSILNERFAKGEIDQKEYDERKKALMSQQ